MQMHLSGSEIYLYLKEEVNAFFIEILWENFSWDIIVNLPKRFDYPNEALVLISMNKRY
jgi:hypothetical protein